MSFLVVIESPKIGAYLFASPWLREIRGAMVLLNLLLRRETKAISKELGLAAYERIYWGGGSGRFLFETQKDAESFRDAVLARFREKAINAGVTVQVLERKAAQSFLEWVSEGVPLARLDAGFPPVNPPGLGGRSVRPCTSCGIESAEFALTERDVSGVCRTCLAKREAAEKIYSKVKPGKRHCRPLESAHNLARQYSNKFVFTNLAQHTELEGYTVYLPRSFEAIGQASRPSNSLGFIHANANRTGEHVKNLASICGNEAEAKRAYRAFSEIIDKATREAAVEAVLDNVDRRDEHSSERLLPAEFMVAGDGDLILAVPAHNALEVAIHFLRKFQEKTVELQQHYIDKKDLQGFFAPNGVSASAGLVLAHLRHPARDLMELAGKLTKSAKTKSADLAQKLKRGEPGGEETGTLDFMVFSQAASEPLQEGRRSKREANPGGDKTIILTERPYTCTEAEGLLETIRALKAGKVTRSKLKALSAALLQKPVQAHSEALTIEERLKAAGDLSGGSAPEDLFAEQSRLPFRENTDGTWSTCLPDIIELYDFVQSSVQGPGS
jgi:hypothetical protein